MEMFTIWFTLKKLSLFVLLPLAQVKKMTLPVLVLESRSLQVVGDGAKPYSGGHSRCKCIL